MNDELALGFCEVADDHGSRDFVTVSPGTPHTLGDVGDENVQLLADFRPALRTESLLETAFRVGPGLRAAARLPDPVRFLVATRLPGRDHDPVALGSLADPLVSRYVGFLAVAGALLVALLSAFLVARAVGVTVLDDPRAAIGREGPASATLGVVLLVGDAVLPVPSSLVMISLGGRSRATSATRAAATTAAGT